MTSFKSRIDSFYAQERRSTLESRFALIWAIVVAVCYLLWNTPPPADRVTRFAIIFAVFGAIVLLVALWAAWRVRGVINRLRSLAPDDRDEVLGQQDRKSTRLNSSHGYISYAVFCLKKKKKNSCTQKR